MHTNSGGDLKPMNNSHFFVSSFVWFCLKITMKVLFFQSYKLDTSKCDAQIPYDCSSGLSHAQPNAGSTVTPPLSSAAEASGSPRPQSYNHTVRRDSPNLHAEKPPDTPGEDGGQAQYISSNLVLITNYNGSVEDVVKEHFSRALNYERNSNESGENKGGCNSTNTHRYIYLANYKCFCNLLQVCEQPTDSKPQF